VMGIFVRPIWYVCEEVREVEELVGRYSLAH
jgi:hypothetical protein